MMSGLRKRFKIVSKLWDRARIKTAFFAITNQCNLRCPSCRFHELRAAERGDVSLADAKAAIKVLADNGFTFISLTGGEPLMHPQLVEICRQITDRGLIISYIPTNGTLVTKEYATALAEAGVGTVGVTVRFPAIVTDPAHRAMVTRARERLAAAGIGTYAGVLLQRGLDITTLAKQLRACGFTRIVFSYPQTDERGPYLAARDTAALRLSREERAACAAAALALKHEHGGPAVYNPSIALRALGSWDGSSDFLSEYPCLAGRALYYIDWTLTIYPCFHHPVPLGNLRDLEMIPSSMTVCNRCTQQAFRDMGPILHAYHGVVGRLKRAVNGRVTAVLPLMFSPTGRGQLQQLVDLMRGGFI